MAKRPKAANAVHGEKKKQVLLALTPTAAEKLGALADSHNLSRSELVERLSRLPQIEEWAAIAAQA